jgi:hypothetical protein
MQDSTVPFYRAQIADVPNGSVFVVTGEKKLFVWMETDIYGGKDQVPPRRVLCALEPHHSRENGFYVARKVKEKVLARVLSTSTPRIGECAPPLQAVVLTHLKSLVGERMRLFYGDRTEADNRGFHYQAMETFCK